MTAGVDNQTFDGMNLNRIQRIINSLKNHTYQPKPARRTYIPKKNKKLRPLGIPSSDDKLVQQIVKLMMFSVMSSVNLPDQSRTTYSTTLVKALMLLLLWADDVKLL